ncbi:MAG: amidohydrolase family protein, partial [Acidobacteria bacterium]|nr:amidohydrolase family protein [Acidobacteriota bacterium]
RYERLYRAVDPAFGDLVRPGVSPHAPYSVSLPVYEATMSLGLPVATHLSESASEIAYLTDGGGAWGAYADLLVTPPGTTGTRLLAEAGLLGRDVVAAHCVVVEPDEIGVLASTGTGVAHCPRSNAALGCGVAPLAELRAAGARVGIGTDSPASAPSFDFFDELRCALLSARARERRADAMTASDALELATLGSACALNRDQDLGSLAAGKCADLQVVSLAGSQWLPWEDPAAAVVFGGSPERILATVVAGETRYEKGGFEWHELTAAAHSARRAMLAPPAVAAPAEAAEAAATPPRAR